MMEQPTTCLLVDDMAAFCGAESVRLFSLISPIKLVIFVVNTSPLAVLVTNGDEATGGGNNKVVVLGDD